MERNFSPALKVRSITLPSAARRSLVRTKAPPFPGLTCWKSRILKTVPSTSMWLPFLNWLVLTMSRRVASVVSLSARDRQALSRTGDAPGIDGAQQGEQLCELPALAESCLHGPHARLLAAWRERRLR